MQITCTTLVHYSCFPCSVTSTYLVGCNNIFVLCFNSQRLTVDECLHHPWLNNFPLKSCIDVILPSDKEELYNNSMEMRNKTESKKYICGENICTDSEYCGREENEHEDIGLTSVDVIVDRGIPC